MMRRRQFLGMVATMPLLSAGTARAGAAPSRSREEFAAALTRVRHSLKYDPKTERSIGMPERQLLALLGPPDYVLHPGDPVPAVGHWQPEVESDDRGSAWCYGTDGPGTLATLGVVELNRSGRLCGVAGSLVRGDFPANLRTLLPEAELRKALRLLDRRPPGFLNLPNGETWDPLWALQVANSLAPLGKTGALTVVEEYLRVTTFCHHRYEARATGWPWMFSVMGLLFAMPEEPEVLVGSEVPIIESIPVLLYGGIQGIAGSVAFPDEAFEGYRKHGRLRFHRLQPGSNPLDILRILPVHPSWPADAAAERARVMVMNQLLRLLAPVYNPRLPEDLRKGMALDGKDAEQRWTEIEQEISRLTLRWKPESNSYG